MISGRVGSLDRALALLEALGSDEVVAAGGHGVGELAATIGRDSVLALLIESPAGGR